MQHLVLACVGGALGAGVRHLVNTAFLKALGAGFPWATFVINITGSLLMGLLAGSLALKAGVAPEWRVFLGTGILGGYTTFSAFSLDTAVLMERGEALAAFGYVAGSVGLSIAALFAGLALARTVLA